MPQMRRNALRTKELPARLCLFGSFRVSKKIEVVAFRSDNTKNRIAVRSLLNLARIQPTRLVKRMQLLEIGALKHNALFPIQLAEFESRHDLDELVFVNLKVSRGHLA